ncbi:MAG: DUF4445 domain-containing protein [Oscillospiraceae bacterium]|nr:DUF4445 domain-containing protein [Oscillospiraceae bacterium]
MPEITINSERKIYAAEGEILLDVLRNAGIYADAPCGGKGICGKCGAKTGGKEILLCGTRVSGDMNITVDNAENGEYISGNFESDKYYAAVIDLGSTTVKVVFCDIESGRAVCGGSYMNVQRMFGADVVSRVEYAVKNGAEKLFDLTRKQLDDIITGAFSRCGVSADRLAKIVVSGNTIMEHIFCREDISGFGAYPFRPVFLKSRRMSARALGYSFDAEITVMPCASAFIGGDIVGGIMVCRRPGENALFADIGTNAEAAVFCGERIYTASAAAGPAFEGGRISCGAGCVGGAINHISMENGMVSVSTINRKPSLGICGSGLTDAVAEFLKNGIIDNTGRFNPDNDYSRYMNEKGFNIIRDIYITQKDIREIQTAKSAIYSGLAALAKDRGHMDVLYLCGGMGEYIDSENAKIIGLLPDFSPDTEIRRMGNTSVRGAAETLFCDKIDLAEEIALQCRETVLADNEFFHDEFIKNMDFNYRY